MKILGGLYLLYIGVSLIRSALRGEGGGAASSSRRGSGYRIGLMTNLSNPKSAAFFGSMFLTLLPQGLPVAGMAVTLAVVFAISLTWYSLVALGFSLDCMRRGYERVHRPLSACIGGLLMSFGARLVFAEE